MSNFKQRYDLKNWLPITKKELKLHAWEEVDVVLLTGDAYVDHPAFGAAVIGRVLQANGYKVAIVPQPNWQDDLRDFKKFGKPRLFFGVTSGSMDSMVNHYTANKRLRSNDAYTPGDKAGARPDYAVTVYSNIVRKLYPDVPIVLGGVEASLRRFTHYDYWSDALKPSILVDSKADLLIYGMGERGIVAIADKLSEGKSIQELNDIPQTAFIRSDFPEKEEIIKLSSHEDCLKSKEKYAQNFKLIETESNKMHSKALIQPVGKKFVMVNEPYEPNTEDELDSYYDLPYTRLPHPKYHKKPTIPAYEMIRHSVNIHRGCFGGCSFCTISAHQGKFIVSRSPKSIMKEVEKVGEMEDFKGYLSDLGGPSANTYKMQGKDLNVCAKCTRPSCIFPKVCKNLNTDVKPMLDLYKKVRSLPYIKKAFIGSGIRYDMFMRDENKEFRQYFREVIEHHVSGRLKVAPEHSEDDVLKQMRKPSFSLFMDFQKLFEKLNKEVGLKQQLIPYFISSHPMCKDEHMAELAAKTKKLNFRLEQVQDFTPTPMTLSTVIYYSGIDPYTGKKVQTAKQKQQKLNQRQFFFWYKKEYKNAIKRSLQQMGRSDLLSKLYKA